MNNIFDTIISSEGLSITSMLICTAASLLLGLGAAAVYRLTTRQLSEREQELSGLKTENSELKSTVDYAAVTAKDVKIFPELSNIRCGSVTDSSGEHALLLADSANPQDAAAQKLLENWLAAETGSSRAEVRVNVPEPEPATDETGTAEEGIPVE